MFFLMWLSRGNFSTKRRATTGKIVHDIIERVIFYQSRDHRISIQRRDRIFSDRKNLPHPLSRDICDTIKHLNTHTHTHDVIIKKFIMYIQNECEEIKRFLLENTCILIHTQAKLILLQENFTNSLYFSSTNKNKK